MFRAAVATLLNAYALDGDPDEVVGAANNALASLSRATVLGFASDIKANTSGDCPLGGDNTTSGRKRP